MFQADVESEHRYFGQKYFISKTKEELLFWLGEAICMSAFKITISLKPPKKGALVLKVIKVFSKAKYNKYHEIWNNLFAESMFYVLEKLKGAFNSWAKIQHPEYILKQANVSCVSSWVGLAGMSEEEKNSFFSFMAQKNIFYEDNPPEDHEILSRLIITSAKTLDNDKLANFVSVSLIKDPLFYIEPHVFAERWNTLSTS